MKQEKVLARQKVQLDKLCERYKLTKGFSWFFYYQWLYIHAVEGIHIEHYKEIMYFLWQIQLDDTKKSHLGFTFLNGFNN